MAAIVHDDQSVLIAVGRSDGVFDGATALSCFGERAALEIEATTNWPGDFMAGNFESVPRTPGPWVWEGRIVATGVGIIPRWDGVWRPAVLGDFARFGLAVPG